MKPEELKTIAEGMGLNPRFRETNSDSVLEAKVGSCGWIDYNPLTNSTQCMEIMEKLKISIQWLPSKKHNYWFSVSHEATGKTINEAVVKAALEYFKGKHPTNKE